MVIIELKNLTKVSLNKWYAGNHWTKRKKLKDDYFYLVRSQTKHQQTNPCKVRYDFTFKSRPLDASNCVAMVKLVEDIIFPDDSYQLVREITITSQKAKSDLVVITIIEIGS